jgi:branched-chain amino acid transport system permease protein
VKIGRFSIQTIVLALIGIGVFIYVPQFTNQFTTFEWANVAFFFIAIMGLNILTGYSGQISLGNGAFMAIGGYAMALMVFWLPHVFPAINPNILAYVGIPIGGVIAFVVGLLVGIPALRLRGIYLALATFALALSVTPLANHFYSITNGHIGIHMPIDATSPPLGLDLSNEQWLYFFDWGVAALLFVPGMLIARSRTGRAWMAIRDSDAAAAASGVNLAVYKTLAFGVSAFYAGVAGALQVLTNSYTNPDNYSLALSLALLVGLVVGGLANVWGPLLGAIIVVWLPYYAEQAGHFRIGGFVLQKPDVFYGVFLILIVLFAPSGLAGLFQRAMRWYRSRRGAEREGLEAAPAVLEAPVDVVSPE